MKQVILTKKRLEALHTAISIEDVLYEKYRRLNERLARDIRAWNRGKQVISVIQKKGGNLYKLQILKEEKTPDGIYVTVGWD